MIETLVELAERYIKTFIDFLALRPKSFLDARNREPSLYLTPYQFLVLTLIFGFFIYTSYFLLTQLTVHEAPGQAVEKAKAVAFRMLALFVFLLFVNSLFIRAISRIWPLRGNATFSSIFQFHCYMPAILLPAMMLDLLLGPLLYELIKIKILPAWSFLILLVLGAIIGLFGLIFWNIPGIAVINGVSTKRVWASLVFWFIAPSIVIVMLIIVLAAYN